MGVCWLQATRSIPKTHFSNTRQIYTQNWKCLTIYCVYAFIYVPRMLCVCLVHIASSMQPPRARRQHIYNTLHIHRAIKEHTHRHSEHNSSVYILINVLKIGAVALCVCVCAALKREKQSFFPSIGEFNNIHLSQ